MALRSPMGRSDSFVNARIGAPRRSGPNEGNASACAPSASDAAAPSKRAAVNAPCPPRPCHRTSIMGLPPSPLHVGHASIALTLSIWVQKGSCGNPDGRTAPSDVPQLPASSPRPHPAAPPHRVPRIPTPPAPPRIPTPSAPRAARPSPLAARHARLPSL